jgi:hypothetical protein
MAELSLRVTKWLGTTPAVGICTKCERTFKFPLESLKITSEAQESLRKQVVEHKCTLVERESLAAEAKLNAEREKQKPPKRTVHN